jgi:Cu2+-exporting ATPase
MTATTLECFHCREPIAAGQALSARIAERRVPVCCAGCRAVAELIAQAGLEDFYQFRTAPAPRPITPANPDRTAYDRASVLERVSRATAGDRRCIDLVIEGVRCAACAWLLERALRRLPGVVEVHVNAATARAHVIWDTCAVALGAILSTIDALGYTPHPVAADTAWHAAGRERATALKRLAVAGFGMMQVMTFAVALYLGTAETMTPAIASYLRTVSMLVATPVLFYAGAPFLASAARALRARTVNMDVPVALALVLAFGASVLNVWRGAGEVYFDSVTMFVFFLSVARFIELVARQRTGGATEAIARMVPALAHRLVASGIEDVPVADLRENDLVLVRTGEIAPADGTLESQNARFDAALLTGESVPVSAQAGERVLAGAVNMSAPATIRVAAVGAATVLAGVVAMLDRAAATKPRIGAAADRAASWFLARVLVATACVAAAWLLIDPARAFEVTLAVLVATCPCAWALATPAAIAAGARALARGGVIVRSTQALEDLARATHVVFDKTGTLTSGHLKVDACQVHGALSETECRALAAALEAASEHPIARALEAPHSTPATAVVTAPGRGVEGRVGARRVRIGTADFVLDTASRAGIDARDSVLLADASGLLASFRLADAVRPEAPAVVSRLESIGLSTSILSGDTDARVAQIATRCGIRSLRAGCLPQDKLQALGAMQQRGAVVIAVGDGVNDAPFLSQADVSIALAGGSALALSSADLGLLGESLAPIPAAVSTARRTVRVIRQNLWWATAYNLTALPLAALGLMPPWLAALGMSMSSLVVVCNALRLAPTRPRRPAGVPGASGLTDAVAGAA